MLLSVAFLQGTAQGQVTSLSNTPPQVSQLTPGNGFSFYENVQSLSSTQSREVTDWISIGTNSSPYGSYNYPVDMSWNTSLSQTIYTAEEIDHESCSIEQVVYTYQTKTSNYPNVVDTEYFRIWLANTDQSSLSEEAGFWIPLEDFTLVYEGIVVLQSGTEQEMLFDLTQPFVYNEANVCIMVERMFSENSFLNHFNFNASTREESDLRSRLYGSYDTPFDFTLPTNDPGQSGMDLPQMADVKLGISSGGEGSLSGTVTNTDGSPVANAFVVVQGANLQTYTNAQGFYQFSYVLPGTYTVNFTAFGFVPVSSSVEVNGSTTYDLVMEYLPKGTVEGNVYDNENTPIAGASIQISGYEAYNGTTDANGYFSIPAVYYYQDYLVAVSKNGFVTKIIDLVVDNANVTMADILLTDVLGSPSKINAVKSDAGAEIDWLSPYERTIYRRDGGDLVLQLSHVDNAEVAVFGQVFRESAKLYQMSWMTDDVNDPREFVNVFVFALNEAGNPTNTIIYEQADVPNVDLQWTTFTFPDTITAENGFYIALSYAGRLEIGIDSGLDPEYPYVNNVNWVSEDYTTNVFLLMEDLGLGQMPGNLMIRAEGYNLDTGESLKAPIAPPSRALNTFKIYRLEDGDEQSPDLWTLLGEELTETNFTDDNFTDLDPGWYKYAVVAVYSGGMESLAGFSNRIENKLTTLLTLNITTNTPTNESYGALVKLINNNGIYVYNQMVEDENGVVVIPDVFKGTYAVSITLDGFDDFFLSNVDFSDEPAYTVDYELVETLLQPFNLEITVHEDLSVLFAWNHTENILEDFESCTDFEIEPEGVVKWKYHDVDKKSTIGITNFTYLNENAPHSFMIFNPSQTTPPIDLGLNPTIAPRSGDKYLASFGVTSGSNDDYFVSPELNFRQNFVFRFWAKSFNDDPAPNKIMVGYSTTGYQPEDFTWITTTAIALPFDRWSEYDYDMTPDVKYVTIRNVSDGGYILMIDDVEIFTPTSARELVTYEVYLNGNLMGQTTEFTYDFEAADIIAGENNVAAVKAIYSSGESEMSAIEFLGVFTNVKQELLPGNMKIYPNPSNGTFTIELDGEYEVTILNSIGASVYNKTITQKEKVTLKDLNPGMYIISAKSNQKAAFKTIIVQ